MNRPARMFKARSPRRRVRLLAVLLVLVAALAGSMTAAWTYWSGVGDPQLGGGAAVAANVGGGSTPIVGNVGASTAVVEWGSSSLSNGVPVDGYVIRRYEEDTGDEQPVGPGCAGTILTNTCTESGVADGHWQYTATPVLASNWRGAESTKSGHLIIGPALLSLTKTLFGVGLPTETTGSLSGFQPGESIVYKLDGDVVLAGSPTVVDSEGAVTITSLTIPDVADGPHTVDAVGVSSGIHANTSILVDTTPPVVTTFITPEPNAAGWNNTPVEVGGSSDDGGGSGVDFVKGTMDGTDPRTSPTAGVFEGQSVPLAETTTIKFYAVDLAGNETEVETLEIKIDTVAPFLLGVEAIEVTGGAYIALPSETLPAGGAFYRGVEAGSFRFSVTVSDFDGSGVISLSTTSLTEAATGFSFDPTMVTTPVGGPFVTAPMSWVAGTTSTPTGTMTVTDLAGNTTVSEGALNEDSVAPAGGSVDATGLVGTNSRWTSSTSLNLVLATGADTGVGIRPGAARLLRATATLISTDAVGNGICGTYSEFVPLGSTDPGATLVDTVPQDNRCYRYEYRVPDYVGNVASYLSGNIKVQSTVPASLTPALQQITPVTGTASQLVSGSTITYRASQSGSFTVAVTASDVTSGVTHVEFPVIAGFTGGGAVWTPTSGTTFHMTYSWSANGASPSPGVQTVTATNHASNTRSKTSAFTVVKDDSAPTHVVSLSAPFRAHLTGTNLFYKSNSNGSFKLVDALTDTGVGPTSVAYPAISANGWTHAAETVSTPSAGPYTSATFTWTALPSPPPTYTITGLDKVGNSSTTALTFVADQTVPYGGAINYPNGIVSVASVSISIVNSSDTGAGVAAGSGINQRDETTLNLATGVCGTFPGTFATVIVPTVDTTVVNGKCYRYRRLVSDNVGNQVTYTSPNIVKLNTTPVVTAITSQQSTGIAGDGRLQIGDKLILTFNQDLAAASVPTTFSGATERRIFFGTVQLSIPGITDGELETSSGGYIGTFGDLATFGGTIALVNAGAATTVTISVTSLTGAATAASSGTFFFKPATTITDTAGTAAITTFTTLSTFKLF